MSDPYVRNCLLVTRGETLFHITQWGSIITTLDGYAIIPMERYDRLMALSEIAADAMLAEALSRKDPRP